MCISGVLKFNEEALKQNHSSQYQEGEKDARINIPTTKLRGSSLSSSNLNNDIDKSLGNNIGVQEINEETKQQTIVLDNVQNNDIVSKNELCDEGSSTLLTTYGHSKTIDTLSNSSVVQIQNIYRSRENLSLIDSDEVDDNINNMDNDISTLQPSDEELKDFLEYMEKEQANEEGVEFEQEQMRKRSAAELGNNLQNMTFYAESNMSIIKDDRKTELSF